MPISQGAINTIMTKVPFDFGIKTGDPGLLRIVGGSHREIRKRDEASRKPPFILEERNAGSALRGTL
jgi:hypothetical protein